VAYNPSFSGDEEDSGLKPAWANSLGDPFSKIPITKRAGGVAQDLGPEFKPQYLKKKERETEIERDWGSNISLKGDLTSLN
jgi:hypothetical protein